MVEPSEDGVLARGANRLGTETSPYLLQHALNPVAWFPWGDEAFRKARAEDKPVFLSIGYSTCHWCHVMAHESFEDAEVARLMNDAFVSIKVDREERPDVDHVYMMVCQAMTGSGGWPLTIIMTPDGMPFFAATYIPRDNKFGRVGLSHLVPRIKDLWANQRDKVLSVADQIVAGLRINLEAGSAARCGDAGDQALGDRYRALLDHAYTGLAEAFDDEHGGFGGPPKFPAPHNLTFLLRYWKRTGQGRALAMAERTLDRMRAGGIYDHLGFGFHRYSTDRIWLVPHFEKMLYDQALLAMAYAEAFEATGSERHRATAEEIVEYVLRDMASPEGGFHSAEDADSEGEEGKFYLWTAGEVGEALGESDAGLAARLFNLTEKGNAADPAAGLPRGSNILHTGEPPDRLVEDLGIPLAVLRERADRIRRRLLAKRSERVRPGKDGKILADWNGLVIAALAAVARVTGKPDYAARGAQAADFVLNKMRTPEGRLLHSWRGGRAGFSANLDDYAFLIWGLVELHEVTSACSHLEAARGLCDAMVAHFWDNAAGGFYFTPDDGERLLLRPKLVHDGALPSGNSVALLALVRLARLTGDQALDARAASLACWLYGPARQSPLASTQYLAGLELLVGPAR